jgi:hypothetical protein
MMEIEMQTLQELHAHYAAVRARLNGGTPKLVVVNLPRPEPIPEPPQPVVEAYQPPKPAFEHPETPSFKIMREVSEKHEMTIRQMKSDSRKIQFVKARQEAAYRLRLELGYSLPQIGRLLGKRDHTTILHAIRRHEKNLAQGTEPWTRQVVSERCEEGITAAQQIVD